MKSVSPGCVKVLHLVEERPRKPLIARASRNGDPCEYSGQNNDSNRREVASDPLQLILPSDSAGVQPVAEIAYTGSD